ncbi:MAG: PorT family protein, partial [Chlorobi bacterium]|nr:PorT family protein [Chlorobiota bacterium]
MNSQVNTSSPYSRFGVGEMENFSLGRTKAMGGISSGIRLPFEINMYNPASYSAIPQNSFLFQVGIKNKRTDYSTNDESITNYDFSLASINAALKVNKYWGMSFGITPVSNIGYKILTSDSVTLDDYTSRYNNTYIGEGGISQLYFGNAFAYKGLSIGINTSYYFGTLSKKTQSLMYETDYISYLSDDEDTKVKDLHVRYGIQYTDSIFGKYNLTVGGFFENTTSLNADVYRYTNRTITIGSEAMISDTIINDTITSGSIEL